MTLRQSRLRYLPEVKRRGRAVTLATAGPINRPFEEVTPMDLLSTLSPSPGLVRVRFQSSEGRWFTVGPLLTLSGARVLAEDMLAEHPRTVSAVRVEHR